MRYVHIYIYICVAYCLLPVAYCLLSIVVPGKAEPPRRHANKNRIAMTDRKAAAMPLEAKTRGTKQEVLDDKREAQNDTRSCV